MEQFRQIGEVVGSMKALMVFKEDIQINQRQCSLLLDMFSLAFESIGEEMRMNLRFDEKHARWKVVEQPLRVLHRVFKEAELYIRQCLEPKDWYAKAITLSHNTDSVEFHLHNLLCYIPIVIEAIEAAGETAGWDVDEVQKKRAVYSMKYHKDFKDPKLFKWKFGKQYLVSRELCNRFNAVWEEDRCILLKKIRGERNSGLSSTKNEQRLKDLLFKTLEESESTGGKLFPSSLLVGSKDYQVRRRLGSGSQYKEIQWLGESFALKHFFGDIEQLVPQISEHLSLSHPHIMHTLCAFTDEDKKECFLVMELMNRDLSSYIKELCGTKKRAPFSLPVAVDLMLQISRGMEYLHSKGIYHGELNPSNILLKGRNISTEGYLHAKVSGFGLSSSVTLAPKTSSTFIWHAPEVLAEEEQSGSFGNFKDTEKSDVYSFGMVCFELLTGKVPFEDSHLQGDKMSRNIRAGERPLFPFNLPKYLTSLTKKCWHTEPNQRPSFSSICRILRYIKRFLAMNPDHSQQDLPTPLIDYFEIEAGLLRKFPAWGSSDPMPISEIPFQMFAYRLVEREKITSCQKDNYESGSEGTSVCGDGSVTPPLDDSILPVSEKKSTISSETMKKKLVLLKKPSDVKTSRQPVTPRSTVRPPQTTPFGRALRMSSESQLVVMSPRTRRQSGHASDSELS